MNVNWEIDRCRRFAERWAAEGPQRLGQWSKADLEAAIYATNAAKKYDRTAERTGNIHWRGGSIDADELIGHYQAALDHLNQHIPQKLVKSTTPSRPKSGSNRGRPRVYPEGIDPAQRAKLYRAGEFERRAKAWADLEAAASEQGFKIPASVATYFGSALLKGNEPE